MAEAEVNSFPCYSSAALLQRWVADACMSRCQVARYAEQMALLAEGSLVEAAGTLTSTGSKASIPGHAFPVLMALAFACPAAEVPPGNGRLPEPHSHTPLILS